MKDIMGHPVSDKFETAYSFKITWCTDPECDCVHIALLNEEEVIFAQVVMAKDQIKKLSDFAQKTAPRFTEKKGTMQ